MDENGEKKCNDMEITYYVKCDETRRSSRNLVESCIPQEPTDQTGQQDPQDPTDPPDPRLAG